MRKAKILIVEDEAVVALDIKNILQNLGYSVTGIAFMGKDAIGKVKKDLPDLVLMDIMLRGELSGIDAAHCIRTDFDIPVVYITAYSGKKTIKEALITNPTGYVLKPIDEKRLQITIEMALYKHGSEKRKAENINRELRESENRYQLLVENINEGIVMQDKDGIITYVNERFEKMLGFPTEEILGKHTRNYLDEEYSENITWEKKGPWKTQELSWNKKNGEKIFTIISPKPIYDTKGNFQGSVSVLTDITERRQVEMELKRSREKLRKLSQYIQSVREMESKRIAREIHDELGQQLTALKMDISWLNQRLYSQENNRERILEKTKSMSELVDKTIQTIQRVTAELRPGLLDDLGLIPAIEWLAEDFQKRTKIQCRMQTNCEDIVLASDCATVIFRISQEALTNVVRHAQATKVDINLNENNGILELKIHDNGKGIKENDIFAPSSLGLMGMRERLYPYDGELQINGNPRSGTILLVFLPLKGLDKK